MAVVAFDGRLAELVELDAQAERIATGFQFTEGPIWHSRNRNLTFSDVRGEAMYRWTESGGVEVFRDPSGGGNGNTYDAEGRLITCEHGNRRVSRTAPDGSIDVIASHYQGKRLNSPNDVVMARNGDVIFTDPPYGLRQPDGSIVGQEVPFNGVFRAVAGSGELLALVDDFDRPNGLVLSEDQSRLYIADTARQHVRVFNVGADGRVSNGRMFVDGINGRPDGMKLDSLGNLYVAANTADGLWVYNPAGECVGHISFDESPANLAWGGDDWRTLFATAQTSVYRIQMKVAGQPVLIR